MDTHLSHDRRRLSEKSRHPRRRGKVHDDLFLAVCDKILARDHPDDIVGVVNDDHVPKPHVVKQSVDSINGSVFSDSVRPCIHKGLEVHELVIVLRDIEV